MTTAPTLNIVSNFTLSYSPLLLEPPYRLQSGAYQDPGAGDGYLQGHLSLVGHPWIQESLDGPKLAASSGSGARASAPRSSCGPVYSPQRSEHIDHMDYL